MYLPRLYNITIELAQVPTAIHDTRVRSQVAVSNVEIKQWSLRTKLSIKYVVHE